MKNERYYYGVLPKEERPIYRTIYEGIRQRLMNINVSANYPPEWIQEIYLRVLFDHPMFYYVNQTVIRMAYGPGHYILMPEYLYTDQDIARINGEIQGVLRKIDEKAQTMLDNPFRLEKFLHDCVVKSVAYDYESLKQTDCYNAHSIVGCFLDNKAVCEGIAKAFKLLCNQYGMKCIVVVGKADSRGIFDGDTYHAWNLVKIGNASYHVDVTWDNMYHEGLQHISYDYFNVTTEDICKDHQPMGDFPLCTDTGLNYFHCTDSFVGTCEELFNLLLQRSKARSIMFKLKPGSPEIPDVEHFKAATYAVLTQLAPIWGPDKKLAVLFNEAQGIGKILFPPEECS